MSRDRAVWTVGMYFDRNGLSGVKVEAQWEAPAPTVNVTPQVIQATNGAVTPHEFKPIEWVQQALDEEKDDAKDRN